MANKKYMRPIVVNNTSLSPAIKALMALVETQAKQLKENEYKIKFLKEQNKKLSVDLLAERSKFIHPSTVTGRTSAKNTTQSITDMLLERAREVKDSETYKLWYEAYIDRTKFGIKPTKMILDDLENDK